MRRRIMEGEKTVRFDLYLPKTMKRFAKSLGQEGLRDLIMSEMKRSKLTETQILFVRAYSKAGRI